MGSLEGDFGSFSYSTCSTWEIPPTTIGPVLHVQEYLFISEAVFTFLSSRPIFLMTNEFTKKSPVTQTQHVHIKPLCNKE